MEITLENIKQVHDDTIGKVYENDYFVDIFSGIASETMTPETPKEIVLFWNKFWETLPDSEYIRRDPFYQICDIAECIFNEEFMENENEVS